MWTDRRPARWESAGRLLGPLFEFETMLKDSGSGVSGAAWCDSTVVVQAADLHKRYGNLEALRGISFEIRRGQVFGLIGPNGAGKTTTVEILEGLRLPDSGRVTVCGLDPARESKELKQKIGAQLQATMLPDKMRVEEALRLFAGFYADSTLIEPLMDRFGLADKRRAYFETLSGGQKQRLALALALVNNPELVLLDEPTAGLDAMVRRDIYATIEQLRAEGRTVLLTTHYIEEAERLCDRVAIIDQGKVVASGTPRQLVERSGQGSRLEVRVSHALPLDRLRQLEGVHDCHKLDGAYAYILYVHPVAKVLVALIRVLEAEGGELLDLHISQPSLEDIFVELTGKRLGKDQE
jgi:ABC-2 type transport system ATP-binding protein